MSDRTLPVKNEYFSIEITDRCTNRCRHCFARRSDTCHDLDFDTALTAAREAFDTGYRDIHITGGEPLLYGKLFRLIEEIFETGFTGMYLNTNAQLVTDDTAVKIASYGEKAALSVTLQGPEENHDFFRGHGTFKKASEGIRRLIEAGVSVDIFVPVSSGIAGALAHFIDSLFGNFPEIRSVFLIQMIRVPGDRFDLSQHMLSPRQFVEMCAAAAGFSFVGRPLYILDNVLANGITEILGLPLPKASPLMRPGRLTLLADGCLSVAHSAHGIAGIYEPGSLKNVLSSEKYATLTENGLDTAQKCAHCRHRDICRKAGITFPSESFRSYEDDFCARAVDEALKFGK